MEEKLKRYKKNIEQLATLCQTQQDTIKGLQGKLEKKTAQAREKEIKSEISKQILQTCIKDNLAKQSGSPDVSRKTVKT